MINRKKLKAGFILSIVGVCLIFAVAILRVSTENRTTEDTIVIFLSQIAYAAICLFFALFARKGSRGNAGGLIIAFFIWNVCAALFMLARSDNFPDLSSYLLSLLLAVVAPSLPTLIGGCLMLKAVPKNIETATQPETNETGDELETKEAEEAETAVIGDGKPVKRKPFPRVTEKCKAAAKKVCAFRDRHLDEGASKWKAFAVLTAFFALFAFLMFACFSTDFFRLSIQQATTSGGPVYDPVTDSWHQVYESKSIIPILSVFTFNLPQGADLWCLIPLIYISVLPVYLVYLGAHNPFRLPRGYRYAFFVLAALLFLLLDIRLFDVTGKLIATLNAGAEQPAGGSSESLTVWIYLLAASAVCAQIASFFLFGFFVGEKASVKTAVLSVMIATLLLPLMAALAVAAIAMLFVLALAAVFLWFILVAVSLFLKNSDDPFLRALRGEKAERKEYTVTTPQGYSMTLYSSNGRDFYDSEGSRVGHSEDGGKTILFD